MKNKKGFTLVEIVVAMAILAIITMFMLTSVTVIVKMFSDSTNNRKEVNKASTTLNTSGGTTSTTDNKVDLNITTPGYTTYSITNRSVNKRSVTLKNEHSTVLRSFDYVG